MSRDTKKPTRRGASYEGFVATLNERIPDVLLVDQLEMELRLGGDEPDQRQMAIRQRARQDVEAHKGYRRADKQETDRKGNMVIRIVRFSDEGDGDGGE